MLFCCLQIKKKCMFKNNLIMSNSLDLDQGVHFVGPDLGPN